MTEAYPPWLVRALADVRLDFREVPGPGSNPRIQQLYRDMRLPVPDDDSKNAWCAVYACHTLMVSGVRYWRRVQLARGALDWGQPTEFRPGAIGVKRRLVDGKDDGLHGHVFFGISQANGLVHAVSGNSHNRVGLADYQIDDVIGWRWPKPSDFLTGEVIL